MTGVVKMDISLDLYRVFRITAKAGSISKAARELYISQPAVSQAIKQLEERLGAQLFTRNSRGIALTHEGEALFGYVEQACSLIESAEERMNQLKNLSGGEIHIGASDTICKHFLLPILEKYHHRYPDINIRVTNRTSYESLELLRAGQVDVAFLNMPITAEGVVVRPCGIVNDCFVFSKHYRNYIGQEFTWEEVAAMPLLMLEPMSNTRKYVDEFCSKQGVVLEPQIELGSFDVLLDFAKIGLGVAGVIREFAQKELKNGELFELKLKMPIPPRHIGLATMRGMNVSFAAQSFIDMLLE